MLDTQEFGDYLQSVGLRDFVGVPCSYLAPLINYAINSERFIMSNNEGDAVAIASGISLCRLNGHSVLSDKSANLRSPTAALTSSKLLVGSLDNANLLKKPAAASPCTASLVFSSQSLECQDSNDMESQANSSNSKIVSEKCGLQGKSQGSLLNANDRRDFSQLPYLSPQAELPTYGVVLMQNSGLSNALSPLTSLNYTFKIPILGFVSLRGERDSSGKNTDEPQHELLGVITDTLLETCEIKCAFLDSDMDRAKMQVQEALEWLEKGESFFFIVRDKTFSKIALSNAGNSSLSQSLNECGNSAQSFTSSKLPSPRFAQHSNLSQDTRIADSKSLESQTNPKINTTTLETKDSSNTKSKPDSKPTQPANKMPTRLEALSVLHTLAKDSKALLLATTGKCGRELYEIEDSPNQLYMVGSMGCVSSLSLGIALKTRQKVIAIDGDSALLMRLGALSTNAYYTRDRDNFCHILLDNESHDSTGGQFNLSPFVDFVVIAKSCGYVNVYIAESLEEFELHIKAFLTYGNSSLGSHLQNTRIADSNIAKSQADSATLKVAKHDFATIQINGGDSQSEMPTLKALSGWGIFKGEQVARPRADKQFKPLPLKEKNKKSKNQNISNKDTSPTAQYDKVIESKTNPSNLDSKKGAWFIYLKIQKGSKENLGRPKITPQEVAQRLSEYMRGCSDEF